MSSASGSSVGSQRRYLGSRQTRSEMIALLSNAEYQDDPDESTEMSETAVNSSASTSSACANSGYVDHSNNSTPEYMTVCEPSMELQSQGSGSNSNNTAQSSGSVSFSSYNDSLTAVKVPLGGGVSVACEVPNSQRLLTKPQLQEAIAPLVESQTSTVVDQQPKPEPSWTVTNLIAAVKMLAYVIQKTTAIKCSAPVIEPSTTTTETKVSFCDPTTVLNEALRQCGIAPLYEPMFGIWDSERNTWIILSEPLDSDNKNLELRARFTFRATNGKQNACRVQKIASGEDIQPVMRNQVMKYLFNQRRHDFLKYYPKPREGMNHILPETSVEKLDLLEDEVLVSALLDLCRLRLETGNCSINVEDPFKLLPRSSRESLKSYGFWKKQFMTWCIQKRFNRMCQLFGGLLANKFVEYFYQKYTTYVESLEPFLNTEIFHLADEIGMISVNGDRGITIAVKQEKFANVMLSQHVEGGESGLRVQTSDDVWTMYLDFLDIADMTMIQPSEHDEKCQIFMSDILARQIALTFSDCKKATLFLECVNGYRNLLGVLPLTREARGKVHGPVTMKFLYEKLATNGSQHACVYRQSSIIKGEYDVIVKYPAEDGHAIFQSSIKKDRGYLVMAEFPEILQNVTSIDDVIYKLFSEGLDQVLGRDVSKAFKNVLSPSLKDVCTLSIKRVADSKKRNFCEPTMERIPEKDIAQVRGVPFHGEKTEMSFRVYSGQISSHKHGDGKKVVQLVRVSLSDGDRGKLQEITEIFEDSFTTHFRASDHCHVVKPLGVTNGPGTSKVLEYSEWGDLGEYFELRARHGLRGDNDQGAITGYWLIQIFYQLAHVLNYLECKNLPHGNVRAENIILSRVSPTPFIKLAPSRVRSWRMRKPTIKDDKFGFAETVVEILHAANATNGESIRHKCSFGAKRKKKKERATLKDLATDIPEWLKIQSMDGQFSLSENFGDTLHRCRNTDINHRPSFREVLQSLATMLHHDVGRDKYCQPVHQTMKHDEPIGLQENIPTIEDAQLHLKGNLGKGAYGVVYLCEYRNKLYAVKDMHHPDRAASTVFYRELETMLMTRIKHKNIAEMKGVTVPTYRIVMDYFEMGSLHDIMRNPKNKNFMNPSFLDIDVLLRLSEDIAMGLQELHRLNILHRDLALRNILMKEEDGRYVAMIADFGLSRIAQGGYYKDYETTNFPLQWYPPESFGSNDTYFAFESDIWSFGITIWEIFATEGPKYNCVPDVENILKHLRRGFRLKKPVLCPKKVYDDIISKCWEMDPSKRIKLPMIIKQLQKKRRVGDLPVEAPINNR